MNVYTGRGDEGNTDLRGGVRISKASARIESYGTVDELNALIGTVRPAPEGDVESVLESIQHDLHVIQAELASNETDIEPRIGGGDVNRLESEIDKFQEEIPPLQSFILPGGSPVGAQLHHVRTVCRRAERRVTELAEAEPISSHLLTYMNRLSDLLFVLARTSNHRAGIEEDQPTYGA